MRYYKGEGIMAKAGKALMIPDELLMNKIYLIRGQKVMIDFDLAELYGVETRSLNKAVKRNAGRFPGDFMYRLSEKKWEILRSQIVISSGEDNSLQNVMSSKKHRGAVYLPYVFSEQGVSMLPDVLNRERHFAATGENRPAGSQEGNFPGMMEILL